MHYYFDKENYNNKNYTIKKSFSVTIFRKYISQYNLYLQSSDIQNLKVDDIRKLKINLQKTPILIMKNDLSFLMILNCST